MRDTVEHGCHGDGKFTCDFFKKIICYFEMSARKIT